VKVTPSALIPSGTNIAALDFGGEIESVTGSYGPGHNGRLLIDGLPEPTWRPEGENPVHPADPAFDHVKFPQEIVLSFYKRDAALVSAVVLRFPKDVSSRPKDIEIWTSMSSPTDNFSPVVKATLDLRTPSETISFSPVQTRYLKIRLLSSTGPDALEIGEIEVIEGLAAGYVPLIARYPEIEGWKSNVRYAAQKGIDWLEPTTIDWQNQNECFGCHVQGQVLMGLAVAKANAYVVSESCMRVLADFTRAKQRDDGTEENDQSTVSPTQYAAMGLAYFDQATELKNDPVFIKSANWLVGHQQPSGAVEPDWDEPPISQGPFMPTANALVAFHGAFANTSDARYDTAANNALAYIAKTKPDTTQDEVFQIIALSQFGTPQQRQLVPQIVRTLVSQQGRDGGWLESASEAGSNALATGEVLYALKQAGVSVTSPEFLAAVRYLIHTQEPTGAWPSVNSQSKRPTEFAPTMWAVIGLAGSYGEVEEPTAESLKSELDKNGRAVLYINFDFNKATIRPDAKPVIAQVVKLMRDNPDLTLAINGHTDNVGLHDYNVKLSQMRAAAVVSSLVASHIPPGRLSSGGFGPDQPIEDNGTEKGRAKNRRVELVKM
jgi:outer membrane protein OmpA-like peptidoglycan-associated protein/putative NIF3 family GTP cyclohydrolase 1 type 2